MAIADLNQLIAGLPQTVDITITFDGGTTSESAGSGDASSYLDVKLTNTGSSVWNNLTLDTYCIDTDRNIGQATKTNVKVYSSYDLEGLASITLPADETDPNDPTGLIELDENGDPVGKRGLIEQPENFDLVNWILNQNFVGKNTVPDDDTYNTSNPGIFHSDDVQAAIWYLIDNSAPTNGPLSSDGLSQTGEYTGGSFIDPDGGNGTPLDLASDSIARVRKIIELAQSNGEGFVPHYDYTNIYGEQSSKASIILVPQNVRGTQFRQFFISEVELAQVGDRVWLDVNDNGIQDGGEPGIAGVTVNLLVDGQIIATTVTDAEGNYRFDVVPGDYDIEFVQPTGLGVTPSDQGSDDTVDSDGLTPPTVTLQPGEQNLTIDLGLTGDLASLGDFVWFDADGDGIQDVGETGVEGVTVELIKDGQVVATTTTAGDGSYLFNNLAPGDYQVQFTAPTDDIIDYAFTSQNTGTDDTVDSDADATGLTQTVTLNAGDNNLTLDAGLVNANEQIPTASIGNFVWEDTNRNGIQDVGENGVDGVNVTLSGAGADGEFGTDDDIIQTTTTANGGKYLFENLTPGDYKVTFSGLPEGYEFTSANQGDPSGTDNNNNGYDDGDEVDSDADPTTGMTQEVVLSPGETNLTLDAGLVNTNEPVTSIVIDKVTNNLSGAAIGDNLVIQIGSDIEWIYTVTNDGEVGLSNIVVTDDIEGVTPIGVDENNDGCIDGDLNKDGILDPNIETWVYKASGIAVEGEYVNLGTVTGEYNGNEVSAVDPSSYHGVVSPGARTPGFWAQHLKLWNGDKNDDTQNNGGGAGKDGFPISDLLLAPYSSFNDTNGDSNGDNKLENAIDPVTDPLTGVNEESLGILVGDYNRNGITDIDEGENTIFYTLQEAQTIVDASQKVQKDDKRYTLSRSLIASWLNWTAGNTAPIDVIDEAIAWIQETTLDEHHVTDPDDPYYDYYLLGDGDLSLGSSVPASDPFWQDPTTLSSGDIIPSGENINNALDYYNNTGVIA